MICVQIRAFLATQVGFWSIEAPQTTHWVWKNSWNLVLSKPQTGRKDDQINSFEVQIRHKDDVFTQS